jgi:hypothetical protein
MLDPAGDGGLGDLDSTAPEIVGQLVGGQTLLCLEVELDPESFLGAEGVLIGHLNLRQSGGSNVVWQVDLLPWWHGSPLRSWQRQQIVSAEADSGSGAPTNILCRKLNRM